jgi:hypothetical protein
VIACKQHHLEQRAAERGYTWEQVAPCIISQDGDTIMVDETHAAYPHARPGLGDMVAAGLSAFGITKERVSKFVGGDCGCRERQQKLNKLGHKYLGIGHPTPSGPAAP